MAIAAAKGLGIQMIDIDEKVFIEKNAPLILEGLW